MIKLSKDKIQFFIEKFEQLVPKEWQVFEFLGLNKSGKIVFKSQEGGLGKNITFYMLSPEALSQGKLKGFEFNRIYARTKAPDVKNSTLWQRYDVTNNYGIHRNNEAINWYKEYVNKDYSVSQELNGKTSAIFMDKNMHVTDISDPNLGAASFLPSAQDYAKSKGVTFEPFTPVYPDARTAYPATSNMLNNLWSRT